MSPDNFRDALRVYLRQVPFRAYYIEFCSGSRIEVRHPEAIDLRGNSIVFRGASGGYSIFDSSSVARFIWEPDSTGATEKQ